MIARIQILVLCSLLAACGAEEHDDIKQWMDEQSKGMKVVVKDPPPLVTPAIISYGSKDLDSPFSPDKIRIKDVTGPNDKTNPNAGRTPEYLEGFPLESLRLIGIIDYGGKMFALIQTPEKPKHVTVGNYMGANFGKITEITKNQVRVTEMVKDANDLWVKQEKVLYLQQEDGGQK
jgi:type IV pilus assembly protein PilP